MKSKPGILDLLSEEQGEWVMELTRRMPLAEVVQKMKERNVEISLSTLKRFVRKRRNVEALAVEEDLRGTAEEMARRGRDGKWREGTLTVVRQKMFEQALSGQGETQAVYGALLEEEARAKELELAERRTKALEERVEVERRRVAILEEKRALGNGRTVVQAQVVGSVVESEGERMIGWSKVAPLVEMLARVEGILNGSGEALDKVQEGRACLAGAGKFLELGEGSARE